MILIQLSLWEHKNIFVIHLYFLSNISIKVGENDIRFFLLQSLNTYLTQLTHVNTVNISINLKLGENNKAALRTWHLQKPEQQNPENGRNISLFLSPSRLGSVLSGVWGPMSCKLNQKSFSLFNIKESHKIDIIKARQYYFFRVLLLNTRLRFARIMPLKTSFMHTFWS